MVGKEDAMKRLVILSVFFISAIVNAEMLPSKILKYPGQAPNGKSCSLGVFYFPLRTNYDSTLQKYVKSTVISYQTDEMAFMSVPFEVSQKVPNPQTGKFELKEYLQFDNFAQNNADSYEIRINLQKNSPFDIESFEIHSFYRSLRTTSQYHHKCILNSNKKTIENYNSIKPVTGGI